MVHTGAIIAHQIAGRAGFDDGAEVRRLHAGPVGAEIRFVGGTANARSARGGVFDAFARGTAVGSVGRTGRKLGAIREGRHAELARTEHGGEGGTDGQRGAEREMGDTSAAGTGELDVKEGGEVDGSRGTEERKGAGERGIATCVIGTFELADGADDLERMRERGGAGTLLGQTMSLLTTSPLRQSFIPRSKAAAWASSM